MKLSNTVKKETLIVALGTLFCGFVMQGIFYLLSRWNLTVLYANLYAWVISCLNFLWMGLTVCAAASINDPQKASRKIKKSQTLRWILLLCLLALGVLLHRYFHVVALVVPFLFPQCVLIMRGILLKNIPHALKEEDEE